MFWTRVFHYALSQVVERLLNLPVEYWSQFMISDDQAHNNHMIIENANVHATPDQKSMNFTSKHLPKITRPIVIFNTTCFLCTVVNMFGPITTPDQQMSKTPSSSSLSQRMKNATLNAITPKYVWTLPVFIWNYETLLFEYLWANHYEHPSCFQVCKQEQSCSQRPSSRELLRLSSAEVAQLFMAKIFFSLGNGCNILHCPTCIFYVWFVHQFKPF